MLQQVVVLWQTVANVLVYIGLLALERFQGV